MAFSIKHLLLALGLAGGLAASASAYVLHQRNLMEQPRYLGGPATASAEEEEEEEGGMRPDKPEEWARFRRLQQADENGMVDPNGAVNAVAARRSMVRAGALPGLGGHAAPRDGAFRPMAAGIDRGTWSWIGPGNVGGRVLALSVDPTDGAKILAGSAGGGIWSTDNGGGSWQPVGEFPGSMAVSTLARSPAAPGVVYAGTGEGFFLCDSLPGAGIFRSTNNGVTWAQLASTNPVKSADWLHVNRISVHPTNPNILLAATGGSSYTARCAGDGTGATSSSGGLYRSIDGGASWTKVFSTANVVDAQFQPTSGNNAIISVRVSFSKYAIYYSNDAGVKWSLSNLTSTNSGGRKEIAYSGSTAYASVDNVAGAFVPTSGGQVWASENGGATWKLRGTPNHLAQGWFANAIWADPTNSQHVIVGGLDLWESLDGGVRWKAISDWIAAPASAHADHHAIVSAPGYGSANRTLFFGNDGGVYKAVDISAITSPTTGWTSLNKGLGVTQFYDGAGSMVGGSSPLIVGGTQDNGSLIYLNNGGTDWQQFGPGDGGFVAVDASTPSLTHAYGEYVYLTLYRADRLDQALVGGQFSGGAIYNGISDAGNSATSLFISPFALNPGNPSMMYAGGASLWRSTNVADETPTWTAVAKSGSLISQIAVAEGAPNNVWFGTIRGAVYSSTTATPAFTSKSTGLPGRMVLSLLVDKTNPSTVYAGFGGYTKANLWRTTNGGSSWTNIHGNLPAVPIYAVQRHPTNPNYLYAGTEVGVFASENGGATWSTVNDGPANVPVMRLFWLNDTTLVAATHGRGMYTANVSMPSGNSLSVQLAGTGVGTVSSVPAGITCGTTCSASFSPGTSVVLTAVAASGSSFTGWSGQCAGSATPTCTVAMTEARAVTATFTASAASGFALTIAKAGTGTGTVTGPAAVSGCQQTCAPTFAPGTKVTLKATAGANSVFAGWSGACTGTGTCTITMSAAKSVTATFNATAFSLGVSLTGAGKGTVTSSPTGISCGTTCTKAFKAATGVTLTAKPSAGSVFKGWAGACSGVSICKISMTQARAVTAEFSAGK